MQARAEHASLLAMLCRAQPRLSKRKASDTTVIVAARRYRRRYKEDDKESHGKGVLLSSDEVAGALQNGESHSVELPAWPYNINKVCGK